MKIIAMLTAINNYIQDPHVVSTIKVLMLDTSGKGVQHINTQD